MYKVYADELGFMVPTRGYALIGNRTKWWIEDDNGVVWRLTRRQTMYVNALKRLTSAKVEVFITEDMVRLTLEDGAKLVLWKDGWVNGNLEEELRPKPWWVRLLNRR